MTYKTSVLVSFLYLSLFRSLFKDMLYFFQQTLKEQLPYARRRYCQGSEIYTYLMGKAVRIINSTNQ